MNSLSETVIKYSSLFINKIDKDSIRLFLESSPLYPNLLSVVQTLQYANIDTQVGRCDWDYLKNLKSPFLLHLRFKSNERLFISMWDAKNNVVKIFHPIKKTWETKRKENLDIVWTGVVIYTDDIQIKSIHTNGKILIYFQIVLIAVILYTAINKFGISTIYNSPIVLGLILSLCTYWHNNKSQINVIERICHISSITDCEAIEKSPYSSLGGLSMSCIAVSFFFSQLICLIISLVMGIENDLYTMYFIAVFVIIPMVIYSVYSQYKIGKICPLCLMILLCVIVQVVIFIYMSAQSVSMVLLVVWVFNVVCLLCLSFLYSNNQLSRQEQLSTRIQLLKIKRNEEVILLESSRVEQIKTPLWLGTETSPINVSTIISPSCKHCRKVVLELLSLIERGIEFRWNVIFGKMRNTDSKIINIWIHGYISDKNKFIHDLHLWGSGKIQDFSNISELEQQNSKVMKICRIYDRQMSCLNIIGFPQIILNGRLLSSVYSAVDLEFLIADQSNTIMMS